MTGEELYAVYKRKCEDAGTLLDEWEQLDEYDRNSWSRTADEVFNPENTAEG